MENGKGEAVLERGGSEKGGRNGSMYAENAVSIVGRFIKDPQVRTVSGDRKRAQFMLAVPRTFEVRQGDTLGEVAFVPVVAWNAIAERCGMLGKGSVIRVVGKLRTWQGNDKKYRWEVSAHGLEVLRTIRVAGVPTEGNA